VEDCTERGAETTREPLPEASPEQRQPAPEGSAEGAGAPAADEGSTRDLVRDYLETVLIAVLIVLFLQTFVFQQSKIPSGSMMDTLLVGDHILVNKFVFGPGAALPGLLPRRQPRRGDVVVFRPPADPGRDYIKRVIGVPGDVVAVRGGRLYLNGQPREEPWVKLSHGVNMGRNYEPHLVPPGHYFLMGDNRDESQDSRVWGTVPRECIHGRAVLVWFSVEGRRTVCYGEGGPWERVRRALNRLIEFPSQVRWDRTFRPIK